ncbi:hypothetical protein C1645_818635 [Glomus cerebriforme]|uniref:TRP C-terminal domain-containing protein n=1 Tax=Glomus cerebriforme TaxID=658196 RepID=A0A397T801_9GLOM|nr:hypothetical protein C1645_818635 [Glomus cerebriforme]
MRHVRPFLIFIGTTLLVQVLQVELIAGDLGVNDDYNGLVILDRGGDWSASKFASNIAYTYKIVDGDPANLMSFVIDGKNVKTHPQCAIFDTCDFFPYPDASCTPPTLECDNKKLELPQPDNILLAFHNTNYLNTITLNIDVKFDSLQKTPKSSGSVPSAPPDLSPLPIPAVISHPGNSPQLVGDITSDGYANCGTIKFDDFKVGYLKEENNIEFYVEGESNINYNGQAQFIVYFDANHIVNKIFLIQVNGLFTIKQNFPIGFDDKFPDALFNTPGTGAYAILKLQDIDLGCVAAPVGSQSTAYSTAISGISIVLALACIPLAASLLFLKKEENYSIYPKKWIDASSYPGSIGKIKDSDKITEVVETTDNDISRDIPSLIPTNTTIVITHNSSFTQTPSIYDFISVAQWIVTTALLTLPNLPVGYRQFASNFGWSTGTGGGINVQAFSNAADNLRRLVCHLSAVCISSSKEFDTCQPWFNSDVTPEYLFTANITNGDRTYFADPTGFDSYSNTLHISNSNIFFVLFVAFLLAICSTLIIMLVIGTAAFKLKEKWTIMKKVSDNISLIVCDENLLWNKEYKIIYGVLYTDYLKNRVWFFIPIMTYQLFRSLVIAFGLNSGAAQLTCLIILEIVQFTAIYHYKPFEKNLANILNMILSAGRLLVLFLLIPFLGGHVTITPATRYSLAIVLIVIQVLMAGSIGGLILLNIMCTIFKVFIRKFGKKVNAERNVDSNQEQPVDNDSSVKE